MSNNIFANPRVEDAVITQLTPNPDNARTHSDKQISQIAASIQRFGFIVPIIIDDDGNIVAGHGRWAAALRLGMRTVPIICVKFFE